MHLDLNFDPLNLIDTHCHLDSYQYFGYCDELVRHSLANGIKQIIIPGADPKDLARAKELANRYKEVYFSVGVHPYHANEFDAKYLEEFLGDEKCLAVGECGLDYFRGKEDEALQKEVFAAQIKLALKYDLPLMIHCREANEDTYEMLKDFKGRGVLHCFNASELLLKLSNNFYYGIGGVLTFKNAKKLVEILPKIPKNRLVLETDAPYLTPHPFRGSINEPSMMYFVAQKMAELLGCDYEEIANLTNKNAKDLFFTRIEKRVKS